MLLCLPDVFIGSNSYIRIIILISIFFLYLLCGLLLSVFEFLSVTFSFWGLLCFSFVIWSFREFSNFKICFASFCSDFEEIHSFIFQFVLKFR